MENVLQLISEILPSVLSIFAVIVAFFKGKGSTKLTAEEIEVKAEAKKQKLITKLNKKNKITPVESSVTTNQATSEIINKETGTTISSGLIKDEFLKNLKVGGESHGNEESTNV